jgi:hypothetical protein
MAEKVFARAGAVQLVATARSHGICFMGMEDEWLEDMCQAPAGVRETWLSG